MTRSRLSALALLSASAFAASSMAQETGLAKPGASSSGQASRAQASQRFHAPVRLKTVDGSFVRTEAPGFAAPTCFDVDGDGKKDLVVGQFNGGKIRVYRNQGDGKLAAGEWLKTGDEIALVPDVW